MTSLNDFGASILGFLQEDIALACYAPPYIYFKEHGEFRDPESENVAADRNNHTILSCM
jgi:hypothetical protein